MDRDAALAHLQSAMRADDVVVTSLASPSRSWKQRQAPHLSYGASDPMGMGPSFGLGLAYALAADRRRVILLEGDGDLLMNLGMLASIAEVDPPNLKMVVLQNGCYETTGCQPTANTFAVDFAAVARGVGFRRAETVDDAAEVPAAVERLLGSTGLGLLALHVDTDFQPYPPAPAWSIGEEKHQFQLRLAHERAQGFPHPPAPSGGEGEISLLIPQGGEG
jgi:thiamine pyrophosphate-dependent acetolactate synthase large subunit-like protein